MWDEVSGLLPVLAAERCELAHFSPDLWPGSREGVWGGVGGGVYEHGPFRVVWPTVGPKGSGQLASRAPGERPLTAADVTPCLF